ncbi:coiled-coil domain-containing protein [Paenibacillaceae bacterium WGS1546]|uniref:coiled-coil domain-containing protein n=1 Tax=Cohnella sp. WGS1546 TaxID=3366810 RepID=UPI00372D33CD
MRRLPALIVAGAVLLLAVSRAGALLPVYAEPYSEETRSLLEQSLSVVELDREIERIAALRAATETAIAAGERRLAEQEIAIAAQREKAGRVLRAYYMGYRDFWLAAILNADSLPEILRVWDAMELIVRSDRKTMDAYATDYQNLKAGYARLTQEREELSSVERELVAQKERIAALRSDLDRALSSSDDEQMLRRLMEELQAYWRNVGLYEVKRHFHALAKAMNRLPEYVKDTPGILTISGLKATLVLTDAQLNEFLRKEDPRFENFSFAFDGGKLTMEGKSGNLQVRIQGRYAIEDEPENAIRFYVDELVFNGLALPDTTRAELEREFDLGFYPQKLIQYVKARSVELADGSLTVELSVGG